MKNCGVKSDFQFSSITKNSDDYDEKYMEIKFNSDHELPLNKMIEVPSMIIILRLIFLENNKHYQQVTATGLEPTTT